MTCDYHIHIHPPKCDPQSVESLLVEILNEVRLLRRKLPPQKPVRPKLIVTSEQGIEGMADKLTFNVIVPAVDQASDIVRREVSVNGGEALSVDGIAEATIGPFSGDQDSQVTVTVVNVDDAGNRSSGDFSYTLTDTMAPAAPNEPRLEVTGESEGELPPPQVDPEQPE